MLDEKDKLLFHLAQSDFPLTQTPYRDLGKKAGMPESEVLSRFRKLKKAGLIRRIGPVWDAKSLGLASLLVAFRVADRDVEKSAKIISKCKGVTHNYLRRARYNMWFTLTCTDALALKRTIRQLVRKVKPAGVLELPSTRIYKIGVKLEA